MDTENLTAGARLKGIVFALAQGSQAIKCGVEPVTTGPRVLQVTPPAYSSSSTAYATQVSSNIVKVVGFGTRTQNDLPTSWSLQLQFKRKL